jgi:hypothetical protein
MRFDMWSARSWEATQNALRIAYEIGPHEGPLDNRVVASFCAAQTAQEFAEMVNPLGPGATAQAQLSDGTAQAILAMVLDDDDD